MAATTTVSHDDTLTLPEDTQFLGACITGIIVDTGLEMPPEHVLDAAEIALLVEFGLTNGFRVNVEGKLSTRFNSVFFTLEVAPGDPRLAWYAQRVHYAMAADEDIHWEPPIPEGMLFTQQQFRNLEMGEKTILLPKDGFGAVRPRDHDSAEAFICKMIASMRKAQPDVVVAIPPALRHRITDDLIDAYARADRALCIHRTITLLRQIGGEVIQSRKNAPVLIQAVRHYMAALPKDNDPARIDLTDLSARGRILAGIPRRDYDGVANLLNSHEELLLRLHHAREIGEFRPVPQARGGTMVMAPAKPEAAGTRRAPAPPPGGPGRPAAAP